MKIEPYRKNQLYRGHCEVSEGGEIELPEEASWVVRKHEGNCFFVPPGEKGEIALILEHNESVVEEKDEFSKATVVGRGFWYVISFLTPKEAKELARELLKAAK